MKRSDIIRELYDSLHTLKIVENISQDRKDIIGKKITELEREIENILMNQFDDIEVEEYVEQIKNNAGKAKDKIKTDGAEMILDIASYVDEAITYAKKIKEYI